MSEISKGKWVALGNTVTLLKNGEYAGLTICKAQAMLCHGVKIPKKEVEANARLMAAAPEMLDVLETLSVLLSCKNADGVSGRQLISDLFEMTDEAEDFFSDFQEAIKKARGEK